MVTGAEQVKQVILSVVMGLALSTQASAEQNSDIAERIKPVGNVCVQGDACASASVSASASSGPRSGADVYAASCGACHGVGVSGAPKLGDVADWQPRLDKGMDVLYASAVNGLNGTMPAKGLCMDCSDDELAAAVDYMIKGE